MSSSAQKPHSRDDFAIVREAISFDYLGPDSNDMDGERWGQDPEAIAALRRIEEQLQELRAAATPFGHMAQEMITGHPTGHLPKGAPERLLAALKAVDRA